MMETDQMNKEALLALDDETLGAIVWMSSCRLQARVALDTDPDWLKVKEAAAPAIAKLNDGFTEEQVNAAMAAMSRVGWPPPGDVLRNACIQAVREAREQVNYLSLKGEALSLQPNLVV